MVPGLIGGAVFVCVDVFKQFVLACSCRLEATSSTEAELETLRIGLHRITACASSLQVLNRAILNLMLQCFS